MEHRPTPRWTGHRVAWCAALAIASGAGADPPIVEGSVLTPQEGPDSVSRIACSPRFCLWLVNHYLGGCTEEDCSSHDLAVTDLEGKTLGPYLWFQPGSPVRFVSADSFDVARAYRNEERNPGAKLGWDFGVDPLHVVEERVRIVKGGAELRGGNAKPEPTKATRRLGEMGAGRCEEYRATPVELAGARRIIAECELRGCATLRCGAALCLHEEGGGIRGGLGDMACVRRDDPERMAFVSPRGLEVEGALPYPVLRVDHAGQGPWVEPPLAVARTMAHVSFGLEHWGGPKDASLRWQLVRTARALELWVEVADDIVVASAARPLSADHVELWFGGEFGVRRIQVGLLLGPEGKVAARLWAKSAEDDPKQVVEHVDGPFDGEGTWSKTDTGYLVRWRVPLAAVLPCALDGLLLPFSIAASDADGRRGQEVLIGHQGRLFLWTQYPPSAEEYGRTAVLRRCARQGQRLKDLLDCARRGPDR